MLTSGLTTGRLPRFVKQYAGLRDTLLDAAGRYPDPAHSYS
jgi:ketopantoate hydroxymethyltransferase